MNLERTVMLAALNTIRPALATKDLIEELTHVWFDGETLTAYNDADLGIQVPFETPFKGGIRGQLLIGILSASRAKEVTLEPMPKNDTAMILKAARARVELAVLAPEKAVWRFPEPQPKKGHPMSEAFLGGLKAVLISVGNDTSLPEKQGVTVDADGKGALTLFTTDSKSIARFDLTDPALKQKFRAIIPTSFCQQLLRLYEPGDILELREKEGCVIASNKAGTLIYARLVACEEPRDFFKVFDERFPDGLPSEKGGLFEIPGRLALALERAIVLMEGATDPKFSLRTDGNKMIVEASAAGRGDLKNDWVELPDGVPDFDVSVEPELIKRAIPLTTHMAFGDCLFMDDGEGFSYLAAYRGGAR